MATAEGKPETSMENNPLPPDAKVWVLRVSIHCEGCKKKVIKIMNKIKGVYRTEVDVNQHKVTVVGNVEVDTLIRSLEKKKGRNWKVELWPQPQKSERTREKKQSRSKNREEPQKQQEQEPSKEAPDNGEKKPKAALQEKTQLGPPTEAETSSKKIENGCGSKDGGETSKNGVEGEDAGEEDTKTEAMKGETSQAQAGNQPKAAAVEKSENGGCGELLDKKGQNGKNTNSDNVAEGGGERSNGSCRSILQPPPSRTSIDSNEVGVNNEYPGSFPNPPPHYYMPSHAPPAYTVSYNHASSYPTVSGYSASYYGPPPPGSSYAYMHPAQEIEAYNPYPYVNESADHVFERFSDENPNACSIM